MSRAADIAAEHIAHLIDARAEAEETNAQLFAHAKALEEQSKEREAKAQACIAELQREIAKLKEPPDDLPVMAVAT